MVPVLLSATLAGQCYLRPAPAAATGPFRRIVVGNLVPDAGARRVDAAILAGNSVWLLYRPDTWGSYQPWNVGSSVDDIAVLSRPNAATDAMIAMGGATPVLLTYAGGPVATPLSVTGWGGIRTVAATTDGASHLVAGLNRTADLLRIGRVTWSPTPTFTQLTNGAVTTQGAAFGIGWADFNNDGEPEALVANSAGLSLYNTTGLRTALIASNNVLSRITRVRVAGRDRVLWLSRAAANGPWCARLLDSSGIVGPVPLTLPIGTNPENGPIDVLGVEGGPIAVDEDGALISYRVGSGVTQTAAYRIDFEQVLVQGIAVAQPGAMFTPGCAAFQDVDGDQRADALRLRAEPRGVEVCPVNLTPQAPQGGSAEPLVMFSLTSSSTPPHLRLAFDPGADNLVDLAVYHRLWSTTNEPGTVSLIGDPMVQHPLQTPIDLDLPPVGSGPYGAFYLEATYYGGPAGDSQSKIYLLAPSSSLNGNHAAAIDLYLEGQILLHSSNPPIHDRELHLIKRPSKSIIPPD